jgi:DNA-binding response OmpR family regulator
MTQSSMVTRVLVVEDNPGDAFLIEELLADTGSGRFDVSNSTTLAAATQALGEDNFDVILLDLSLPDSAGMDTVSAMRATAPNIPIVVLTGLDDEKVGLQALQNDAQDYFVKSDLSSRALERTIRYATERKQIDTKFREQKLQLDAAIDNMVQGLLMYDADGRIVLVNQRYIGLYGVSPDIAKVGCSDIDLIKHRIELGIFSGDPDARSQDIRARSALGKS